MEIQIAIAKTNMMGSDISGDTLEVVERPMGGYSVVLCDGQTTGTAAKSLSSLVVRKVIALIAEGVRDSAAARAASDHVFSLYSGKNSAYLDILSADLQSNTLVICRNNPTALYITRENHLTEAMSGSSESVGYRYGISPIVAEIPIETGLTVVMSTDGFLEAGEKFEQPIDIPVLMSSLLDYQQPTAQEIADALLKHAINADHDQPQDDMSVVVLRVLPEATDNIRRLTVNLPITLTTESTYPEY
jgi:serine phosphatase RsbU (regulator of sigma subunit)